MANLLDTPITETDLEEYLNGYSDFSFEIRVLNKFTELGFKCEHGGTYEDPITEKSREYDIRALYMRNFMRLHLSVECKNIRDNFPLVVHCMRRKKSESYNEVIRTFNPDIEKDQSYVVGFEKNAEVKRLETGLTIYRDGEYVAKSADQVGRKTDKTITSTDGGVFDKISQAINSAYDLIVAAKYLKVINHPYISFVFPVLVLPDNTLWQVSYDDDGNIQGKPERIKRISYYFGKEWTTGAVVDSISYTLSHLEIVTYSELDKFVKGYLLRHLEDTVYM